jgi:hypothetical protein
VTFHDFLKKVRSIPGEMGGANIFFVEDVAYKKAAIQEMERAMLPVVPMKPNNRQAQQVAGRSAIHQERHSLISTKRMRGAARASFQSGRRIA